MASSKRFLHYILDQLSGLEVVTYRGMMGNISCITVEKLRRIFVMTGCWSSRFRQRWQRCPMPGMSRPVKGQRICCWLRR